MVERRGERNRPGGAGTGPRPVRHLRHAAGAGRPARCRALVFPGRRHARLARNRDPDLRLLAAALRRRSVRGGRTLTVDSRPAHRDRRDAGATFSFRNNLPELILPSGSTATRSSWEISATRASRGSSPASPCSRPTPIVARMLAIWLKAWPPPPGFSRALFENARFGPKLQPLKQEVVGDIGHGAVGPDGNHRAGAADRLRERRESAAGARREAGSRNWRFAPRWAPAGAASRAKCCSKA